MIKDIAFCKVGKSIKFVGNYSPIGGDNEAPALIRLLANNNPHMLFHIVGRSDFSRLSEADRLKLFPYDNVKDAFEGKSGPADENAVIDYFNKLGHQPDAVVMMVGQVGTVTIPNRIRQVKDDSLFASVIDMTKNYTTPIIKWWNENPELHVIEIINDPRYVLDQSRDIIHNPTKSLSQYTYSYKKNTIISYEDQTRIEHIISPVYAEMEKIFLYDRQLPTINAETRTVPFMIVLNEGSPSRYKMLKEWILDYMDDVEIYGKWEHPDTLDDPRFKGSLPLDDIHDKLKHVRATFIIPIAEGWATSKYIEMIHAGVIPLLHPTYDSQRNTGLSNNLRPLLPKDLPKIMEYLSDDNIYTKVITDLRKEFCGTDYFDGSALNRIIMKNIDSEYKRPQLKQYEKKSAFTLEGFLS